MIQNAAIGSPLFREIIEKYIVLFTYNKVTDGTDRKTIGTRNIEYIPNSGDLVGGNYNGPCLPYWAYESNGWRSCYTEKVDIYDFYTLEEFEDLYGPIESVTQTNLSNIF